MKRLGTVRHRLSGHTLVESSDLALMHVGERQQITIGDMRRVKKTRSVSVLAVEQRYIVRPEGVSGQVPE